ncbi:hypothetical protein Mapa_002702 [Marchantia paleacea]|nr:hypothetical protein Mapa_002702 [Marchantia paleacea]
MGMRSQRMSQVIYVYSRSPQFACNVLDSSYVPPAVKILKRSNGRYNPLQSFLRFSCISVFFFHFTDV